MLDNPLDVSRAATALLDSDGRVLIWSPAATKLLGYQASDMLGREITDLSTEAVAPELGPGPQRVLRLRRRDGGNARIAVTVLVIPSDRAESATRLLAMADADEAEKWNALQSMLRGLATHSPTPLAIYDASLRVVWANAALYKDADYIGVGPDDMVTDGVILTPDMPDSLEEVMSRVLATGEPVLDLYYRGRPPSDPNHDHVWSCSYYRLEASPGSPLGVCEEAVDITERFYAQQHLDLLVRAARSVGTTLDMGRTAREFADAVTPGFADTVTVDLARNVLNGSQTGFVDVSDTRTSRLWPPDEHPEHPTASAPTASAPAVADGQAPATALRAREPEQLVIPLRADGAVLGSVTFTWKHRTTPFHAGERAVANELVTRLATCVDNARRYADEHAVALLLQRSLLPRVLPRPSAVELAFRYLPADSRAGVGGDWFDVIALSGARVGLVVGDVVGHGLRAAATMGRLRTSVRVLAQMDLPPEEILTRLDDLISQGSGVRTSIESDEPSEDEAVGVTCLYAVYDPVSGTCTMARAGHPLPAIVDPDSGTVTFPDLPSAPPLGVGSLPFESKELTLPPGSLLALFTDGLIQRRDLDPDEQLDLLGKVLTQPTGQLDDLCDKVIQAMLPNPADDDAALLLVRTQILGRHQVAEWQLTNDPQSVRWARAEAAHQVRAWGLDDLAGTTELVVSELVTNAIRHAPSGPIQLRLLRDQTLICEVSDSGHTSPHLRHAAGDDEGGRGLFIVAQMTEQWGTRYTATGKTIWTSQDIRGDVPDDGR
ncbi:SpoIIE family protein phosphatase [Streptomyces sp. NBC_00435]